MQLKFKPKKNYELVVDVIQAAEDYMSTVEISSSTGLTKHQVRACMKHAKDHFASIGIPLVNKFGSGYKLSTMDDQEIEMTKTCVRALQGFRAQYHRTKMMEKAGSEIPAKMTHYLAENTNSVRMVIKTPEEFSDSASYGEYLKKLKVTPDFISSIAESPIRQ